MNSLPPQTWQFESNTPGPKITILGGIHGDELLGVQLINQLKEDFGKRILKVISGKLTLMIGNPKAVKECIRPTDNDINRLFGTTKEFQPTPGTYEETRVNEIKSVLQETEILIDIHATSSPAEAFIYCEATPEHIQIATKLNVNLIVSPDPNFRPPSFNSATDNFVDRNGGIGITYETGQQSDTSQFQTVYNNILNLLADLGIIDQRPITLTNIKPKQIIINQEIIAEKDFQFTKDFNNFDRIQKGETIAIQNNQPLKAKEDCIIVFPTTPITPGKPACYIGHLTQNTLPQ